MTSQCSEESFLRLKELRRSRSSQKMGKAATRMDHWFPLSPPREPLNWRIWLNRTARAFLKSIRFSVLHGRRIEVCFSFLFHNLCFFVFLYSSHYTMFFLFAPFPLICEFTSHFKSLPPSHFLFSLNPKFFLPLYLVSLLT